MEDGRAYMHVKKQANGNRIVPQKRSQNRQKQKASVLYHLIPIKTSNSNNRLHLLIYQDQRGNMTFHMIHTFAHMQFRTAGASTEASRSIRCNRHGSTQPELPEARHRGTKPPSLQYGDGGGGHTRDMHKDSSNNHDRILAV